MKSSVLVNMSIITFALLLGIMWQPTQAAVRGSNGKMGMGMGMGKMKMMGMGKMKMSGSKRGGGSKKGGGGSKKGGRAGPTSSPTSVLTTQPTARPTSSPTSVLTTQPTAVPSLSPSAAPTTVCKLSSPDRSLLIRKILNSVSNSNDLDTPGTPQNTAANWIINQDTRFVCPGNPTLIQRYSLAVLYYSTDGNRWTQCNAPSNFDDPASIAVANANCAIEPFPGTGSDAWLTPGSECQYGGVVCGPFGTVTTLDIGMYSFQERL
jgi:hypothetical protein